ncbi:Dyp-type peroxidase [Aliidiomarina sanyensis]|uniref:Peroxidase n=1 Tax=Aliidiomarina sanyensis TaxID=1249555 RepID=A0A432WI79_9GAMM|nr:Dyp-type peroxidase [Aliidiomarina sanyensis]RUO33526.1 hypothetical protein CWE11_06710 [Aliidiomarina sanyensis]
MNRLQRPQTGIFAEPSLHGLFLFFHIDTDEVSRARQALAALPDCYHHWQDYFSEAQLSVAIGIGDAYWDVVSPSNRPDGLRGVPDFSRSDHPFPTTPFDVVIVICSDRMDANHATAQALMAELAGVAVLAEERHTYRHLDGRDRFGFKVNPQQIHAAQRRERALVRTEDDPEFADGSFLWIQQSLTEIDRFKRLTTAEQERIVGYDRLHGRKLQTAKNSAASREHGDVWCQRMPTATVRKPAEMLFAFSRKMGSLQDWMASRFLPDADGATDPLLDYLQVEHNSLYFVPSEHGLFRLAEIED